ncbi:endogenous retrovirus group K3 member 1 [Eulemur rufifrons]|uniref:endogenous retrovirus group K3 member 1 n=1 Tax=Eulemur rufifrons TaxID=859984 RepID=UPI003744B153
MLNPYEEMKVIWYMLVVSALQYLRYASLAFQKNETRNRDIKMAVKEMNGAKKMTDQQSGFQTEESKPEWKLEGKKRKTCQAQTMTWGQLKRTYEEADRILNWTSVPKTSANLFLAMICVVSMMSGENSKEDKNPETNASL